MTTTDIGRLGEKLAVKFLKKEGYRIIERNRHESHNEIDMIAKTKTDIVFVEVKTRTVASEIHASDVSPAAAVDHAKQKRTIVAARNFISKHERLSSLQPRFDVIEVYLLKDTYHLLQINHIKDAFWT